MECAPSPPVYAGIDVAKDRLDVHVLPSGKTLVLNNDDTGHLGLGSFLADLTPALVVLLVGGTAGSSTKTKRAPRWRSIRRQRTAGAASSDVVVGSVPR